MKIKESEKIKNYLAEKAVKRVGDGYTNCMLTPRKSLEYLEKRLGELEIRKKSRPSRPQQCKTHLEYSGESWRPEKT